MIAFPGDYVLVHEKFWATRIFSDPKSPYLNNSPVYRLNSSNPESPRRMLLEINDGCCWLEGDDPSHSRDSRHYGEVSGGMIEGKVWARIVPFHLRKWILSEYKLEGPSGGEMKENEEKEENNNNNNNNMKKRKKQKKTGTNLFGADYNKVEDESYRTVVIKKQTCR